MVNDNNSREEILKYLSDLQSHYAAYHNHKETTAWGGVALFFLLLPNLTTVIGAGPSLSCPTICAATFGIIAITVVMIMYMHQQFALRRRGGDLVAASCFLRAGYIAGTTMIDVKQFAPPVTGHGPMKSGYCLPIVVLDKANELEKQGQGALYTLENCGYALIIFICLFCIMKLWSVTP